MATLERYESEGWLWTPLEAGRTIVFDPWGVKNSAQWLKPLKEQLI
jgi:hypothetical protein